MSDNIVPIGFKRASEQSEAKLEESVKNKEMILGMLNDLIEQVNNDNVSGLYILALDQSENNWTHRFIGFDLVRLMGMLTSGVIRIGTELN